MASSQSKTIIKGTSIVSTLTLVSRILGFLRDHVIARYLGAGMFTDVFYVAFRIPNLLRNLFAEGALSSAFLPVFAEEKQKSTEAAQDLLQRMLSVVLLITASISVLGVTFGDSVISVIAAGFDANPEMKELCVSLTRIIFPYIVFVSCVALLNAALISFRVFGGAAIAQIVMNLALIAAAASGHFLASEQTLFVLAWATLFGGLLQICFQFPLLRKAGLTLRYSLQIMSPATKKIFTLFLPAFLGAAVYQLITFVNTMLASSLVVGSVSWLSYADRLAHLPIGVFSVALGSVLFPSLSQNIAQNDKEQFNATLLNGLRYLSFVIIPASIGLCYLAHPLIQLVFESGKFTSTDSLQAAAALQGLSLGLWATSCHTLLVRGFHAFKDMITPCFVALLILIVGFYTSLALMGPLQAQAETAILSFLYAQQKYVFSYFGTLPNLGHVGLALSSGIMSTFSFLILFLIIIIRKKIKVTPFILASLRAVIGSISMCIVLHILPKFSDWQLLEVSIQIVIAGVSYMLISLLLQSQEAKETLSVLLKNMKKN